MLILEEFLAFK